MNTLPVVHLWWGCAQTNTALKERSFDFVAYGPQVISAHSQPSAHASCTSCDWVLDTRRSLPSTQARTLQTLVDSN